RCARAARRNVEEEQRRASLEADDLELESRHRLSRDPRVRLPDRGLDVAVGFPLGIEVRRFRRDADVIDELRDDVLVPLARDAFGEERCHGGYFSMLRAWKRCPGSRSSPARTWCG